MGWSWAACRSLWWLQRRRLEGFRAGLGLWLAGAPCAGRSQSCSKMAGLGCKEQPAPPVQLTLCASSPFFPRTELEGCRKMWFLGGRGQGRQIAGKWWWQRRNRAHPCTTVRAGAAPGLSTTPQSPRGLEKTPDFPASCSKHCGIAPLGKDLPKREVFQPGEGLGWSGRQVAPAGSQDRAMPPPSSLPGDQGKPTELLSGFWHSVYAALGQF